MVFAHTGAERAAYVFKAAGQAVGPRLRSGAIELLELEVDLQHIPKDKTLERGVVRADLASVRCHTLRKRMLWEPRHDGLVVERVGHAEHLGAQVLRVVVDARAL